MTTYFLEITSDLLLEMFGNPLFEIIAITFLFVVGLSVFQLLRKSV